MKHMKGKKFGLMIFIITVFLAIPISTVYAQIAMKGDPVIVCTKAELILPQEKIANNEYTTYADFVLNLSVTLRTLKHKATAVNATLRFKNEASLMVEQTITGERNKPVIVQKQANWDIIGFREEKENILPFKVKGFNHLPEKIEFELDVTYRNPNDEEIYTTTLSIIPGIPDTTINIISISSPPDKPKGEKIPITVTVKNEGTYESFGMVIQIKIKSIRAFSDFQTITYSPYENADGAIILIEMFYFMLDNINPGQQRAFNVNFHYAHSNGAMNVGKWKVIEVAAQAANSDVDVMSTNPEFKVTAKNYGSGPHAVFIYYLWNSEGYYSNFGTNPRPYFEHTTYGSVKAGLHMFKKQYNQRSDHYIDFNMIICKEDSSLNWPYPENIYYPTNEAIYNLAIDHVGSKLNIEYGEWQDQAPLDVDNCGFDLLLVAFGSKSDHAGMAFAKNAVVVTMAGASTYASKWKYNIDGVVQHEISHCFNCYDYEHEGSAYHPLKKCIMVYKSTYRHYNYLFEKLIWPWIYVNDPTNNWCTGSSYCECTPEFQDYWNQYYKPLTF